LGLRTFYYLDAEAKLSVRNVVKDILRPNSFSILKMFVSP
jgi:hypothetical protein